MKTDTDHRIRIIDPPRLATLDTPPYQASPDREGPGEGQL